MNIDKMKIIAKPILSSTVIPVRNGSDGLEVFMVLRNPKSDFASGALVFPGGKVDKEDRSDELYKLCDQADPLEKDSLSIRVGAIRETFEESGMLFVREKVEKTMITADHLALLQDDRVRLNRKEITIAQFLETRGLIMACDYLAYFAHWITPEPLPMRFDTHFFLAPVPSGFTGTHDGEESVDSLWITPEKAVMDADAGKYTLMFPTKMNLLKLGEKKNVSEVILETKLHSVSTIMPVIERKKTGCFISIPENAGYLASYVRQKYS